MLIATKGSKIDISSEKKTEEIAKKIISEIIPGNVLFLYGEMGVGKTTFVKYLINGFQFKFKEKLTEVTSPTFNIMNEYDVSDLKIKHYDLYRLKSVEELNDLNLFEKNDKSILLIEWPEILTKKAVKIFKNHKNVQILWASTREVLNYQQAKKCKCHIITMSPTLIDKLNTQKIPLKKWSIKTVQQFFADGKKSNFSI